VARYYLQLRDGTGQLLDPEGIEYGDLDHLKKAVLLTVRDMMSGDAITGTIDMRFRVDAGNRDGAIIYSLGFQEAVRVIPDT
jgi:hypothetical protein